MVDPKSLAKLAFGRIAAVAFPALLKEVRAGDIEGPRRRLKRLIGQAELARLHGGGESARIEHALTGRWTAQNLSSDYYDVHADRFESMFAGPHSPIINWLKAFALEAGVTQVIEVGCGDGRALAAMSRQIPEIPRWSGVDINAAIIERNLETYAANDALTFVASDASAWLEAHVGPGVLLMTYGGVMEYIAPETLTRWFALVADKGGAGILLTEPVDPDHDLDSDPASHLWGAESSYSHNHRALLQAAGYRLVKTTEVTSHGYRWVMIMAAPKSSAP